jgi:uncharacterized membrane protein YcfT
VNKEATHKPRVDWVDYAKGICIILVVMMHSTLGVEKAAATITPLHNFIDWARPFRMPDFFMISGLFLASRIAKEWRSYFDSKVLHFAYFYVLWMTIQFIFRDFTILRNERPQTIFFSYVQGFYEPYGTLWFIYLLAVFFVITKLLHHVPAFLVFAVAAMLEIAPIETGSTIIDEFASRYVYFFAGFWLAKYVFNFSAFVARRSPAEISVGLLVWAYFNFMMVHEGLSQLPVLGLGLGFVGAAAVVSTGVLLSKFKMAQAIGFLGQNSIVIYLSFSLFMATNRLLLLKYAPELDLVLVSLLSTFAGVTGPIIVFWLTRETHASFLFRRPAWAKLEKPDKQWHSVNYVRKLNTKIR